MAMGTGLAEDIDRDGTVGIGDLAILMRNWLGRGGVEGQWVSDSQTSGAIDAGAAGQDIGDELWPNGERVNMGAYGGTVQASWSPDSAGNVADINHDDMVNALDLEQLAQHWTREEELLASDLNRDGRVNLTDFAMMADNWLWQE